MHSTINVHSCAIIFNIFNFRSKVIVFGHVHKVNVGRCQFLVKFKQMTFVGFGQIQPRVSVMLTSLLIVMSCDFFNFPIFLRLLRGGEKFKLRTLFFFQMCFLCFQIKFYVLFQSVFLLNHCNSVSDQGVCKKVGRII